MDVASVKMMSALCIAQPWATCIFEHDKNVENGSRNITKRGTIAIYASRSYAKWRMETCKDEYGVDLEFDELTKGAILGFATVVDVLEPGQSGVPRKYHKWWQPEYYGLVLEDIVLLKKPVPVKPPNGAVKFWHLKGRALKESLAQVPRAKLAKFKEWV